MISDAAIQILDDLVRHVVANGTPTDDQDAVVWAVGDEAAERGIEWIQTMSCEELNSHVFDILDGLSEIEPPEPFYNYEPDPAAEWGEMQQDLIDAYRRER